MMEIIQYLIILVVILILSLIAIIRRKRKMENRIKDEFGSIPDYFEDEDLSYLESFYRFKEKEDKKLVDDITWNDLDMDKVFQRINICLSSVGEEYLYYSLHDLKGSKLEIERRENILSWFRRDEEARVDIRKRLFRLGKRKKNGLSSFIFETKTKLLKYSWIYTILALIPILGIILTIISMKTGFIFLILSIFINTFIYSKETIKIEGELETMKYFSSLIYASKKIDKKYGSKLKSLDIDLSKKLHPLKKVGGILPGGIRLVSTGIMESFTVLLKTIFLLDLIFYNRAIKKLMKYNKEFSELFEIIGEIDMSISILSFRDSLEEYCIPNFIDDMKVSFKDIYHPLIKKPIKNSCSIDNDSIITGSNASGKSTFIKAVAINNILAQSINTCCSRSYSLPFSYVASSMAIKDNILLGNSYFIEEIKSLKRIINYCEEGRCICFIDEILRGTNTPERIAASTAVLEVLHGLDSLCIVASHDIELTRILEGIYNNYNFSEKFIDKKIEFDYLLKEGPSISRNAIKLLDYMGFSDDIIKRAKAIIEEEAYKV